MKLNDWLKHSHTSVRTLARALKCTRSNVYAYLQGTHLPSLTRAAEIERLSGGLVKVSELVRQEVP